MNEIDKLKKDAGLLTEMHEQEAGFKKERPRVNYVLSKHSSILTASEIKLLQYYQRYITNKETSMSYSDIDKVKPMIEYLSRV